ncbi:MAG: sulfatase-like hydrolase/transferase [Pseudomonadota bacterium]
MKHAIVLAVAAGVVFAALVLPNHPGTMKWSALNRWPLELPVILLGLIALGWRRGFTHVLALVLLAAVTVKLADFVMFEAYNRKFDAILDMYLLHPAFSLVSDSIGQGWAILTGLGVLGALAGLYVLFLWALQTWAALRPAWPVRLSAAGLAVVASVWAAADVAHHLKAWTFERSPPGTAWTSRLLITRGQEMQSAAADLARFRVEAAEDPFADRDGLLNTLAGRDVILIWLESYGRASFDNPLYAPTHGATLRAAETVIANTGLTMRSGWLTAPTAGGQSWLSHATFASGMWTTDQARYTALLASGQNWLFHIAQNAGFRTAAVMPAITMAWPESAAMGFDQVFPATDIPYEGARFRWVTMPDQFTLSAYPNLLAPDPRPDFLQVALISSHAPWTPIPEIVPWDEIGDGTIFNAMATLGPTPRELWKDRDAVREAYRRSVDYVLEVTFSHVARVAADQSRPAPLIIVAGDHQSAPFVAGSENRDVAVHMIGTADLLTRIDAWQWTPGLIPDAQSPVRRMDRFRDDFIDAFTESEKALGLLQ